MISSISRDEPENKTYADSYKYDSRENIAEHSYTSYTKNSGNKFSTVKTFKYNTNNKKTEEIHASGSTISKKIFRYDNQGNLVATIDGHDNTDTWTYTYDNQNNWVKKVKSQNSNGTKSYQIIEREIKYYDVKEITPGSYIQGKPYVLEGSNEAKTDTKDSKVAPVMTVEDVTKYIKNANDLKITGTFLKNYSLNNSENIGVNMHEFIEKNRRFKDKPTLVVTWAFWCPPCLAIIDKILKSDITANYNIAIVNRDGKTDYADIKSKISIRKTDYFTNDILFLIDRENQLEALDKNSAPMFIWLDKKLAIKGIYNSYDITISAINSMFQQIE